MLVAAFSKLVPRALQKKVAPMFRSSDADARSSETNVCHVVLLDDTEIQLNIKVGRFHDNNVNILLHKCLYTALQLSLYVEIS